MDSNIEHSGHPYKDDKVDSTENRAPGDDVSSSPSASTLKSNSDASNSDSDSDSPENSVLDSIFDDYLPIHLWGWVVPADDDDEGNTPDPSTSPNPDPRPKKRYATVEEDIRHDKDLHPCDRYPLGPPGLRLKSAPLPLLKIARRWKAYEARLGITINRGMSKRELRIARSRIEREKRRLEHGIPTTTTLSRDMLDEAEAEAKNDEVIRKLRIRKSIRIVNRLPGVVTRPCLRCAKKGLRCSLVVSLNVNLMFAARCNSCMHAGEEFCVLRVQRKADVCDWGSYEKNEEVPPASVVHMQLKGVKEYWAFVRVVGVDEKRLRDIVLDMLRDEGSASLGSIGIYSSDGFSSWALPAWDFESESEAEDETGAENPPGLDHEAPEAPGKPRVKPRISRPSRPISVTSSLAREMRFEDAQKGWVEFPPLLRRVQKLRRDNRLKWA
ncbi:hypothetical protein QBC34DRAFT_489300 [Podospora aff. communis PSN243]|uniref:Zn(2)-C6 fungal-type domain-containing protein n=1 Tax=Podospora aff. communis PSN243 TaxID=3040156 RepID=A0AAV9H659_9PEZI|nr:hypothetical protein QBC34DRAFT_489300 [Podospora aff. communis PSN243]